MTQDVGNLADCIVVLVQCEKLPPQFRVTDIKRRFNGKFAEKHINTVLSNYAEGGYMVTHGHQRARFRRISEGLYEVLAGKPKENSFTVECAFCNGKGIITDGIFPSRDCPVRGCKAGWLILDGNQSDYKPCGTCKGTGKEGNDIFGWKPCHFCHGSGFVKIH